MWDSLRLGRMQSWERSRHVFDLRFFFFSGIHICFWSEEGFKVPRVFNLRDFLVGYFSVFGGKRNFKVPCLQHAISVQRTLEVLRQFLPIWVIFVWSYTFIMKKLLETLTVRRNYGHHMQISTRSWCICVS